MASVCSHAARNVVVNASISTKIQSCCFGHGLVVEICHSEKRAFLHHICIQGALIRANAQKLQEKIVNHCVWTQRMVKTRRKSRARDAGLYPFWSQAQKRQREGAWKPSNSNIFSVNILAPFWGIQPSELHATKWVVRTIRNGLSRTEVEHAVRQWSIALAHT